MHVGTDDKAGGERLIKFLLASSANRRRSSRTSQFLFFTYYIINLPRWSRAHLALRYFSVDVYPALLFVSRADLFINLVQLRVRSFSRCRWSHGCCRIWIPLVLDQILRFRLSVRGCVVDILTKAYIGCWLSNINFVSISVNIASIDRCNHRTSERKFTVTRYAKMYTITRVNYSLEWNSRTYEFTYIFAI